MLKDSIQNALNDQIQAEFHSAYLYLSMAAWCESRNFDGFGHWMRMQAQEEMLHAMKVYDYVHMTGGRVKLQAVQQPEVDWDSSLALFRASLKHEQYMTGRINDLLSLAMKENDHATANMLQWFISEQVEEEATVDAICNKLQMMGDNIQTIYMLDRELAARPAPGATATA
ncbi:ferritin [bacterium]|nr:ferritin [bacterium]HPF35658.1 ferritin [Candidatus Krumholzibacteria bacterium]HRX51342.1 ferritin [Candidatus Krumholzibacteria bacterium]